MSRWLIKADISEPNKIDNSSNVPLEDPSKQVEEEPYGYEKNENKWKENFNENRNTNGVIGVEEDGYKPFTTISNGHK